MDTDVPEEVTAILRKLKKVWKQARAGAVTCDFPPPHLFGSWRRGGRP